MSTAPESSSGPSHDHDHAGVRSGSRVGFIKALASLTVWLPIIVIAVVVALLQKPRGDGLVASEFPSVDWWLHRPERNAFARLPALTGGVNAIDARPGSSELWVAGGGGFIGYTGDDGRTWHRASINTVAVDTVGNRAAADRATQRQRVVDELTSDRLQADSARQAIARATVVNDPKQQSKASPAQQVAQNGTEVDRWNKILSRLATDTVRLRNQLDSLDRSSGVATRAEIDSAANVTSIAFSTRRIGWAIADGTLLQTLDSGRTWSPAARQAGVTVRAVLGKSNGTAMLAVNGSAIAIDSLGATIQSTPLTNAPTIATAMFASTSDSSTWLVANGAVLRAARGGPLAPTYQFANRSGAPEQLWIAARDSLHATIVERVGASPPLSALTTSDGGRTWSPYTLSAGAAGPLAPEPPGIVATGLTGTVVPTFIDGSHGWIFANGTVSTTRDGGATWSRESGAPMDTISTTLFRDPKVGWVASASGALFKTTNGGVSWTQLTSGARNAVRAIAAIDARTAVAVGDRGHILRTTDGGAVWTSVESGTSRDLYGVSFATETNAWAVGDSGTLLHSVDRGLVWQSVKLSGDTTRPRLLDVAFLTPQNGIAIVDGSARATMAYETRDGGATWSGPAQVDSLSSTRPVALAGLDTARGVARAIIGGAVWKIVTPPLSRLPLPPSDGIDTVTALRGRALSAVFFSDAAHGWVAGPGGALFATTDSARSWHSQPSPTASDIRRIVFVDARNGWLAADYGVLRATHDGGATWSAPLSYRAGLFAPWFYVVFLVALAGLARASLRSVPAPPRVAKIEERLVSDGPLTSAQYDALGFTDLALGISRFIRNANTEPPLTIAITGPWGTGKTSLINLVREDLRRWRFKPIWFNAWHHQKEEHLLASLLHVIESQAVPPIWTRRGMRFRWRLIVNRSSRYRSPLFVGVVLLAIWIGFRSLHPDGTHLSDVGTPLPKLGNPLVDDVVEMLDAFVHKFVPGGSLASVQALSAFWPVALLSFLWQSLRAFGAKPETLLAGLSRAPRTKDLAAKTGFRQQFAEEFREVTEALKPHTMVIIIDDLDRCRPEQVLEVLESVNFLVSSGDCFVIAGIDRDRVVRSVGVGVKDIARAFVEPTADITPERAQLEYAERYLEKLINVEIAVPRSTPAELAQLIAARQRSEQAAETDGVGAENNGAGRDAAPRARWAEAAWIRALARSSGFVLAASLVVGAFFVSRALFRETLAPATSGVATAPSSTTAPPTSPNATTSIENRAPTTPAVAPRAKRPPADIVVGQETQTPRWPGYGLILLTLGVAGLVFWFRQEPSPIEHDSDEFASAVELWAPVIFDGGTTPRSAKRLLNQLRFYAMRQRSRGALSLRTRLHLALGCATFGDSAQEIVAVLTRRSISKPNVPDIPDRHLVSLGVLRQLAPEYFDGEMPPELPERLRRREDWEMLSSAMTFVNDSEWTTSRTRFRAMLNGDQLN